MFQIKSALIAAFLLSGCTQTTVTSECESAVVFNYSDFGPQAIAYDFIGNEWWQWSTSGDGNPDTQYNIKVVVHSDKSSKEAMTTYPVVEAKAQDYRYAQYSDTLVYLNKNIEELEAGVQDGMPFGNLIKTLETTKMRVTDTVCAQQ